MTSPQQIAPTSMSAERRSVLPLQWLVTPVRCNALSAISLQTPREYKTHMGRSVAYLSHPGSIAIPVLA